MIRKDFLERLIEQLAAMVRRAFALSDAGDVDGALALFDESTSRSGCRGTRSPGSTRAPCARWSATEPPRSRSC